MVRARFLFNLQVYLKIFAPGHSFGHMRNITYKSLVYFVMNLFITNLNCVTEPRYPAGILDTVTSVLRKLLSTYCPFPLLCSVQQLMRILILKTSLLTAHVCNFCRNHALQTDCHVLSISHFTQRVWAGTC